MTVACVASNTVEYGRVLLPKCVQHSQVLNVIQLHYKWRLWKRRSITGRYMKQREHKKGKQAIPIGNGERSELKGIRI